MDHKTSFFKKADIFLAVALLLLGLGSFLLLQSRQKAGDTVTVTVDGSLYGTYPLAEDRTERIDTALGSNTLRIEGGRVWISEADCPNHDCVEKGAIAKQGQIILCLPHKLSVTITEQEGGGADAVSY